MNRYCGLYVHKDSVYACISDTQGEKIFNYFVSGFQE
jgi:hypothetical protein